MVALLFYILVPIVSALLIGLFCLLKFWKFKGSEKLHNVTTKILKVLVVIYCSIMLLSILLPDSFNLCLSKEKLGSGIMQGHAVLRWFSMACFSVLPIAVFFKNRAVRNVAITFCVAVTIAQIACFAQYLDCFTSATGKGLNSLPVSEGFRAFLINPAFRKVWFAVIIVLQLTTPIVLAINENHLFKYNDKIEWRNYFIALPLIILASIPVYVPQYLFGQTDVIFSAYSWLHFLWIFLLFGTLAALYFGFRKQSSEVKMVVLFVLALSLLMQYDQMFGAISLNIKRLPLQLCNLGAYLIILSLITKNKKIFNFTVIINVVGVLFAIAKPDLEGKGFFYYYNMHFIFEHSNVLIVPILALLFGIFPRLDKFALRDCLIGFTIYFLSVFALGTMFNAIASATGKGIYEANFLFMFLPDVAIKMIPFTKALFDINFKIGYATFYPVLQLIVYAIFILVCVLLYYCFRLIYLIKDKIVLKRAALAQSENSQSRNNLIENDGASGENNEEQGSEVEGEK